MPLIDFCFQGWVRGAPVETAVGKSGEEINVSKMSSKELCDKLKAGELYIRLGDYLYDSHKASIEIHDYEPKD
jgi:hypothetical protein